MALTRATDKIIANADGNLNLSGIVTASLAPSGDLNVGNNIKLGTASGIITASAFFGDGSNLEGVSSSGIGTPLSDDDTSDLNKVYYVNQELSIGSTVTVNHPDSAVASYTHYQDLVVTDDADFIVADGDTFIPDVLGIRTSTSTASAATGGRIRAGTITNAGANGAPNFPNGLTGTAATFTNSSTIAGIVTLTSGGVDTVGVVTASSFDGSLAATKLTGTIADARISSSSVTQHVTSFDDASIRHDISMLALHFADTNNKTAFDLANSTIDQMETAASISTSTTTSFNSASANEYWKAGTETEVASGITDFPSNSGLSGTVNLSLLTNDNLTDWAFHTDSSGVGAYFVIDLQAQKNITKIRLNTGPGVTNSVNWQIQGSNDNASFSDTGADIDVSNKAGWTEIDGFNANYRYFKFYKTTGAQGGGYHRELEMYEGALTATGSITSNTYTASSSRTQVAGVLLYRDLYGTATLGTDLKVFYSCNNGSNFTEASSYTLLSMAFKTGVKAVTLGKSTCTAGTQIKFKVEWANQSTGSKETAVQGVALQY